MKVIIHLLEPKKLADAASSEFINLYNGKGIVLTNNFFLDEFNNEYLSQCCRKIDYISESNNVDPFLEIQISRIDSNENNKTIPAQTYFLSVQNLLHGLNNPEQHFI